MALKKTSSTIIISGLVTESAANAFTQVAIDLQLNPLDNEVFVIEAVDVSADAPEGIAGTNTAVRVSLSNTSRTTIGRLNDSNVFASSTYQIMGGGFLDSGVGFSSLSPDSPTAGSLEYIAILATDNFFAGIDGTGNVLPKTGRFKVYGYRAKADSATYAALVQSELLSQ